MPRAARQGCHSLLRISLPVSVLFHVANHDFDDFQSKNPRRSQHKVEEAVEMFVRMENWDGLAVIFTQLPSGRTACSLICGRLKTGQGQRLRGATLSQEKSHMPSLTHEYWPVSIRANVGWA